jgi:hypothetical protein
MTAPKNLLQTVDHLLRGGFTEPDSLRAGQVTVPVRTAVVAALVCGAAYGAFMGLYGVLRPEQPSVLQLLANMAKVPLLFLVTLVVTVPSLYVVSALARSRLRFVETLRLLLVAIVVHLALLASFGPVTGFFTLSTESYPFMIVLNVAFFAVGGIAGLVFLRRAVDTIFEVDAPPSSESTPAGGPPAVPMARLPRPAHGSASRRIFVVWTVIYGAVGAQTGWILRPFIGSPDLPFTLFRERESNFFEAFLRALGRLFS